MTILFTNNMITLNIQDDLLIQIHRNQLQGVELGDTCQVVLKSKISGRELVTTAAVTSLTNCFILIIQGDISVVGMNAQLYIKEAGKMVYESEMMIMNYSNN